MKNIIYILTVIVFFNLSLVCLYYLKVINNYGFVIFNNFLDVIFTNIIVFLCLSIYTYIYIKFMIGKFNYLKVMILGLLLGVIISLFIPTLIFEERLLISLFTSFSLTFISYSVYFDSVKQNVFK